MKYLFISLLTLLLAHSLGLAQTSAPDTTPDELTGQWSEPVDGLACRIARVDATLYIGGYHTIDVEVKNTSDNAIDGVLPPVHWWRFGSISLICDQTTLSQADPHRPSFVPHGDRSTTIEPGEIRTFTHRIFINGQGGDGIGNIETFGFRSEFLRPFMLFIQGPARQPGEYQLQYAPTPSRDLTSPPLTVELIRPEITALIDYTIAHAQQLDQRERYAQMELLKHLTCRDFAKTENRDSLAHFQAWWAQHRDEPWQEWILTALEGDNADARRLAAGRAVLITDAAYQSRIAAHLDPAEPELSGPIFQALWLNFQDPAALAYARVLLESDAPARAKGNMLSTIFTHSIAELYPLIIERLTVETDPEALTRLVSYAGSMKLVEAADEVEQIIQRDGLPVEVTVECIRTLTKLKGQDYEDALIAFLANDVPEIRADAIWRLYFLDSTKAIPTLVPMLAEKDYQVVNGICYILKKQVASMTPEQIQQAGDLATELINDPTNSMLRNSAYMLILKDLRQTLQAPPEPTPQSGEGD